MNTPPPPKRNNYPFRGFALDEFCIFTFEDKADLIKCRAAAHSLGARKGWWFTSRVDGNKLTVTRIL